MEDVSTQPLDQAKGFALIIAGIIFFVQFLSFMVFFNFNGLTFFWIIGWLLLIPGFLVLGSTGFDSREDGVKKFVARITPNPIADGWFIVCIALAMISQHWTSLVCVIVQLPLIAFIYYYK